MASTVDPDPFREGQLGGGWVGFLTVLLVGLGGVAFGVAGAEGAWWRPALFVVVGAGAMGGVYWVHLRQLRRRATARADALRDEKREAEAALEAATERAEKLEEMSAAKSHFLKEVSHAFRRPLTLTLGPIDTVLERAASSLGEDAQTQLQVARRNGTRLLWLVNQLSDLAELETGSMVLAPDEGNFPAFVARSLRSFEDLAERRDVTLEFESTLDNPVARFDSQKIATILANLVSSAFRVAEKGTSIRVTVRPVPEATEGTVDAEGPSPDLELLVEHPGTGVVPGEDGRPFERSFDGELLREPGSVSTNVGLRLVDELADLHGGHLQVDGASGQAVQWSVRLPRHPPEQPDRAQGETDDSSGQDPDAQGRGNEKNRRILALSRNALAQEPPSASSETATSGPSLSPETADREALPGEEALPGPRAHSGDGGGAAGAAEAEDRTTVLVIDDNSVICTLVRAHLEPEYRVKEAHDGAEGYALARRLLPDLVITDVMMPEVDGFELCRKIKKDPDIDHVPVVFLTARADLEDKVEGFDTGADAYLTKPFEPEELIARVENLIATRRALRASFRAEGHTGGAGEGPALENGGLSAEALENAEAALPPTAEARSLKEQIEEAIAEHLTDPEFGVSELASATALSTSQLRRRMKGIYDRTPVQLIRRRRLEAGARLLRERPGATIGEVAYAVGFNSQSYFSRSFREEFGSSPSQYRNEGVAA